MRRRDFITLLGGAAAWPVAGRAQPNSKLRTIGLLTSGTAYSSGLWVAAFDQRLRELGWIEARTVSIVHRFAEGHVERYSGIIAEFVRLNVDVMVVGSTAMTVAKQATSTIPIVFPMAQDPVGTGFVASLARPGGNITGLSAQQADTAGKRVGLLREVVPSLQRLAIMANLGDSGVRVEIDELQAAAGALGVELVTSDIRRADEIAPAFEALGGSVQALYVTADAVLNSNRTRVITWEHVARLPTMHGLRDDVDAGALMSYGPNAAEMWRRSAEIVDKILRGTKPADIPVAQPTKFELVVNLTTAKAIGWTIPPSLIAIADEVIE
jgi:putative ABC transport system substrate-binding protein